MNPFNNLLNQLGENLYDLEDNEIIQLQKFSFAYETPSKIILAIEQQRLNFPDTVIRFHKQVEKFRFSWKAKNRVKNPECNGYIQILDYPNVLKERLFGDWFPEAIPEWYLEGKATTFEHIEFYHFEILEDGYGTGYFVGGDFDDTIYYHGNDRDIYSMDVDIDGYIQLLAKTYGLVYWQKVIVDIKNGTRSWEYDNFEGNMKVINPNFKMSEFEQLYNNLRLTKNKK